jgi:hypothetical protein
MIQNFIDSFMKNKYQLETKYSEKHPSSYEEIFQDVIRIIYNDEGYDNPDIDRITTIDHGEYQGTRLFIVGATGYQPSKYWSCKVDYGSCSGCDTYENIRSYDDDPPSKQQIEDYITLALHMVQNIKEV